MQNPDRKKYVVRLRKGEPILVDKQIIRWRKRRKAEAAKTNPKPAVDPIARIVYNAQKSFIGDDQPVAKGVGATDLFNPFWTDED